jgi:hypothetical protein
MQLYRNFNCKIDLRSNHASLNSRQIIFEKLETAKKTGARQYGVSGPYFVIRSVEGKVQPCSHPFSGCHVLIRIPLCAEILLLSLFMLNKFPAKFFQFKYLSLFKHIFEQIDGIGDQIEKAAKVD